MERWDKSVHDINAISHTRHAYHTGSGLDTTSYPYSKGKLTALNTMASENYQGLAIYFSSFWQHLP